MSGDDAQVVRSMYEAYLSGDMEGALGRCHPDVIVDFTVRGDIGVERGREAFATVVADWVNTWDDYREQLDELRDLGDQVLVVATQTGRGKGSGVETTNQWAWLYVVDDGLVTSVTAYNGRDAALEAAGAND